MRRISHTVARLGITWLAGVLLCIASVGVTPAEATEESAPAWVLLGPEGQVIARAVTSAEACPTLVVDGDELPMQPRAERSSDFDVLVCDATIPPGAREASVDGQLLALPVAEPQRILVIGDTGCRLKEGSPIQACNDPDAWPLAQVAASAAAWQPDLVIHVGDYHYRESPCPADDEGCAGSPWGDNWETWDTDFWTPTAALRQAAPWIVVRGNHEDCARAGVGYFLLVDPRPVPEDGCVDISEPYVVPVGAERLLVFDSASAQDSAAPPALVAEYRERIERAIEIADGASWLLVHHPLAVYVESVRLATGSPATSNLTLAAAWDGDLPSSLQLALAGHVHQAQVIEFGGDRPVQLTVGNSGTLLDPPIQGPLTGWVVDGLPISFGWMWDDFGFATMAPVGDTWTITFRTADGLPVLSCGISDRLADCGPVGK